MRGPALLLLLTSAAHAKDLPARLSVERATGAEPCAGQSELVRRVEGILRRPLAVGGAEVSLSLAVRFERTTAGAFVARVSASGPKPGQRVLHDRGPTCDALSEAVAVTIALLLDSAASDTATTTTEPTEPPAPAAVTPAAVAPVEASEAQSPTPTSARPSASERWSARAAIEAGGGYGLAGSATLLGVGRLGARRGPWTFDIDLSATWPRSHDFETGSVSTSLLIGSLRACYLRGRSLALGPCLQLAVGRLRGDGSGYEQPQSISLPWLAAGLGLGAEAPLAHGLYVSVGATLWVPSERHTFSVQNAGIAWESRRLAGTVTAGLGLELF